MSETDDPWLIAESESDGFPLIYRIRQTRVTDATRARYPNLLSLLWRHEPQPSGMPSEEEEELMNEFEDRLEALEGDSLLHLTVVVTGNNEKEWFIYVGDVEAFMGAFSTALQGMAALPLEIEGSTDPEWSSHESFLASVQQG